MNYNIKEINKINKMHEEDIENSCLSDDEGDDTMTAKYIFDNFNNMTINDKKNLVNKLITKKQLNRFLLRYEMKNLKFNNQNNLNLEEFSSFIYKNIKRYQGVASGFYIDDNEWIIKKSSRKHIFLNTLDEEDSLDNDTEFFLNFIVNKLDKLSDKYEITYSIHSDEEDKDIDILQITILDEDEKPKDDEIRI